MSSTFIIGIAGGSASGKTSFTSELYKEFQDKVTIISCDDYYKPTDGYSESEKKTINYDHPNAIEADLLKKHIEKLKIGCSVETPVYDFSVHNRTSEKRIKKAARIIIVEGILLFHYVDIRKLFDLKIYIDSDSDERILRRIKRDMEQRGRSFDDVQNQYFNTVKPMHDLFVEPTKKYANIIVNGGKDPMALELVRYYINSALL